MIRADANELRLGEIAAQATFGGCLAVLTLPRDLLLSMVPPGIVLPRDADNACSCLLAFGEHSEGTAFLGGVPLPWGGRYNELMVAIPFVRWDRSSGEHLFISGMMCDAWWAVWNGNVHYGYRKRLASICWDGERFLATSHGHEPDFDARLGRRARSSHADLSWVLRAARLPVLGLRDDGRFVRSRFDWSLLDEDAETAALRLITSRQFRDLPFTAHQPHGIAYRIHRMRWRISWPFRASST